MSYTTLYAIYPTEAQEIGSLANSWLSAPPVWETLAQKHLGWSDLGVLMLKSDAERQKLWNLFTDPKVEESWRIVHGMIMTNAVVPIHRLNEAADACLAVAADLRQGGRFRQTHWQVIGQTLRDIALNGHESITADCLGIAVGVNSVSDPWSYYGEEDEDTGKSGTPPVFDCIAVAKFENTGDESPETEPKTETETVPV